MTGEIIIDGIDVAGCEFIFERDNKQKCECCHATGFRVICDCDKWHTCYYKQLQRLKQENEKLKEKIESYNCNANCYKYKEANKYKQVLEEIRQFCITYMGNDATRPIYESILKIADGASELLPEDEIPF